MNYGIRRRGHRLVEAATFKKILGETDVSTPARYLLGSMSGAVDGRRMTSDRTWWN
jgi:hypothetical protein